MIEPQPRPFHMSTTKDDRQVPVDIHQVEGGDPLARDDAQDVVDDAVVRRQDRLDNTGHHDRREKIGQIGNGLGQFLEMLVADFGDHDRENDRETEIENNLQKAQDKSVPDQDQAVVIVEITLEIQEADPGAFPDAHVKAEFFEGHDIAGHRDVGKNDVGHKAWQKEQVENPVGVNLFPHR